MVLTKPIRITETVDKIIEENRKYPRETKSEILERLLTTK